jgi:hypothetical protein
MIRSKSVGPSGRATGCLSLAYTLFILVALAADPLLAQPFRWYAAPPASPSLEAKRSFQAKIHEQARLLARDPRLKRVPTIQRQALLEFVLGNVLFVAAHEMGHAFLSEMKLPVLGGEEQAADDFAILTALKHGERDFSDRILIEAAKGWFVSGRRDKSHTPDYYDRHGLSLWRGYRIVCLMIGADPVRFKALAEETMMPKERQRTCGWEYGRVSRSWERVLTRYRRAADQPKTQIEVIYGEATGELGAYARMFRNLQFLETIADLAADRLAWREPIAMEMRSCGNAGATWTIPARRLQICYEMARDFAELYRDMHRTRKQRSAKP